MIYISFGFVLENSSNYRKAPVVIKTTGFPMTTMISLAATLWIGGGALFVHGILTNPYASHSSHGTLDDLLRLRPAALVALAAFMAVWPAVWIAAHLGGSIGSRRISRRSGWILQPVARKSMLHAPTKPTITVPRWIGPKLPVRW